ncbi:MAG: acetyl-CoA hydrolase/transferase C-terminal domain-containing protein [Flavonifractor plautii]
MTGKNGQLKSCIVPTLTQGSITTAPCTAVYYLMMEYGMVNLKGASTWERAEKIISIAHPDFREELSGQAEKMDIWRQSNKLID